MTLKVKNRLKLIYTILIYLAHAGLTGVLIFEAALPGKQSSSHSGAVGEVVADTINEISGDKSEEIEPTEISFKNKITEGTIGQSFILPVSVLPENSTYKEYKIESSDPEVISVDQNGTIRFISEGSASITVTSTRNEKLKDVIENITVSRIPVQKVETQIKSNETGDILTSDENGVYHVYLNQTYTLVSEITPENSTHSSIKYSSDKNNFISLSTRSFSAINMSLNDEDITTITTAIDDEPVGYETNNLKIFVENVEGFTELESISASTNPIKLQAFKKYTTANLQSLAGVTFTPTNATYKGLTATAPTLSKSGTYFIPKNLYNVDNAQPITFTSSQYPDITCSTSYYSEEVLASSFSIKISGQTSAITGYVGSSSLTVSPTFTSNAGIYPSAYYAPTSYVEYYSSNPSIVSVNKTSGAIRINNSANEGDSAVISAKIKGSYFDNTLPYIDAGNSITVNVIEPEKVPGFEDVESIVMDESTIPDEAYYMSDAISNQDTKYLISGKNYPLSTYFKVSQLLDKDNKEINLSKEAYATIYNENSEIIATNQSVININEAGTYNIVITHKGTSLSTSYTFKVIPIIDQILVDEKSLYLASKETTFNKKNFFKGFSEINTQLTKELTFDLSCLPENVLNYFKVGYMFESNKTATLEEIENKLIDEHKIKFKSIKNGTSTILFYLYNDQMDLAVFGSPITITSTHLLVDSIDFNVSKSVGENYESVEMEDNGGHHFIQCNPNDKFKVETIKNPSEATSFKLIYASSDSVNCKFYSNGMVSFVAAGDYTISVTDSVNGATNDIVFRVRNIITFAEDAYNITGPSLKQNDKDQYELTNKASYTLKINFAEDATFKKVAYTSSNENVAKISQSGSISCLDLGESLITALIDDGYTKAKFEIKIKVVAKKAVELTSEFLLLIRKLMGHFGAFMVLGIISSMLFVVLYRWKEWLWSIPVALTNGIIIAALTELIQIYTPGRGGLIADVILDSRGFLLGAAVTAAIVVLVCILHRFVFKKKAKQAENIDSNQESTSETNTSEKE